MTMLTKPTARNVPSERFAICSRVRRSPVGFKNGITPSITKTSAKAASRSFHMHAPPLTIRLARRAARLVEIAEELAAGINDQQVILAAERVDIRVETAIKAVKLSVFAIGIGISGGGPAIALAARALRVPVGFS